MELSHLLLFLLLCCSTHGEASSLPASPAAGPILPRRPFVVVWNMPTSGCQTRYGVQLDLNHFDIVENHKQRFQGQNMSIFYRDRLGRYPYLSRGGGKVNGGIPQLGDLDAHLSLAVTQLSGFLQPNFTGMAVIDWEEWQPLWVRNVGSKMAYRRLSKLLVRQERPDLSEEAAALVARLNFEESAQKFMEETLRSAVRDHPGGLWGFYGFPSCFNKHKTKTEETYTGRCHSSTRQQNDRLSWLWSQSSALYPSIYLPQRLAGSPDAALMVRHRLLEALRVASLWRHGNTTIHATPVLPYARLAFTHTLNFLNKTDLQHTLGESASLGAAGVVLWGELSFAKSKRQCVLLRDYIHNVLGPFVQSLRSGVQRCSLQLCQGNGRCTRRRPSSASTGYFDRHEIDLLTDSSSDGAFHRHYRCRCYSGWTGQKCRKKKVD
ncbi:hyaluronidase-3 [Stegastes partitus]|uniref:Hyaluronidase n=1 Tax=Stegastes partitus TaxID=144197 RepID=A0A3B4Z4Z6_9TELE|nr:PREDICTED: hyaluronidase-3-like [Stegastes partitus]XP_008282946.1 PREDICTED: hyaluronidase-3-like [Stegastes partitus]